MNNEATGVLIRTLRKEKKLTQKELAQRLNVTDRAVSKWERGPRFPELVHLPPFLPEGRCGKAGKKGTDRFRLQQLQRR